MKMWICADKDETQWLICSLLNPVYDEENDKWDCDKRTFINKCFVGYNKYPEVTFENSPQEVELKLIEKWQQMNF